MGKFEWIAPDTPCFLGYPVTHWLAILTCIRVRKITVLDLLHQFEKDHPLDYNYLAWKAHFGLLADLQDEQEGFNK